MRVFFTIVISFLISFFAIKEATAINYENNCRYIYKELLSDDGDYLSGFSGLLSSLSEVEKAERNKVLLAIDALHFIDYYDQVDELLKMANKKLKVNEAYYPIAYNRLKADVSKQVDYSNLLEASIAGSKAKRTKALKKLKDDSFQNFIEGRSYLISDKPEINIQTLKKLHSIFMKGNVDGLEKKHLGKIRGDFEVIGNVPPGWAIKPAEFNTIKRSKYLDFVENGELEDGRKHGQIQYPFVTSVQDKTLALIKDKNLVASIKKFRDTGVGSKAKLNEKMLEALIEEAISRFSAQRKKIGALTTSAKISKYIDLTAAFQRDIISIHPFADGNGRTTREFALNFALMKEGLPPTRLVNPDQDLYSPLTQWQRQVKWGVVSTHKLIEDFTMRSNMDLSFRNSPELLTPYLLRQVYISYKKRGSKKAMAEHTKVAVDTKEFMVFFKYLLKDRKDLVKRLEDEPEKTWKAIGRYFRRFENRNRKIFSTKYEGKHEISLHFADFDFMHTFGTVFSDDATKWQSKMDMWYMDEINWRGLTSKDQVMEESDILNIFSKITDRMVSNNVLRRANKMDHNSLKKLAIEDMNRYNEHLYGGGLAEMALDHSRAGKLYGQSYGYSTSDKYAVAKAFAMGAMVIADYGKHTDLELQKLLKSRVVVGAKRAKKDVDLMRLKPLRDEFSNIYWRQSEVMGIGGADPDSIMIVKTVDEHGETILSYVRNPKEPSQIWVVKGDWDETSKRVPSKSRLEKILTL